MRPPDPVGNSVGLHSTKMLEFFFALSLPSPFATPPEAENKRGKLHRIQRIYGLFSRHKGRPKTNAIRIRRAARGFSRETRVRPSDASNRQGPDRRETLRRAQAPPARIRLRAIPRLKWGLAWRPAYPRRYRQSQYSS